MSNLFARNNQSFLLVPVLFADDGTFAVDIMTEECHRLLVEENSRNLTEKEMLESISEYLMMPAHLHLRQCSESALADFLWTSWVRAGKIDEDPMGEPIVRARFNRVLAHVLRSNANFHVDPRGMVLIRFVDGDFRDDEGGPPFLRWTSVAWEAKLDATREHLAKQATKKKRGRPSKAA